MKATVTWVNGEMFVGESPSGNAVVMEAGEKKNAVGPMEMILLGVGGCSSVDVVSILQKARQDVIGCRCELTAERPDTVPSPFEKIHLEFVVTGRNIKETQVARAVELSAEKYCSASIMLGNAGVEITHGYRIEEI
ncbi:OsmC family protein [Biformimicrobium ophioploci]|uniref:OsmC family protein n=1 Tax=Biformimicrobium ophioploci TaxID=3036711 RepID=A0ABQ6LUI3_9GAMM|nr:OsmC family protein [Microbulbifer sp. NKW57]GMG85716.1 OsmC family protein [Microbulbifer sp. NKW57]